MPVKCTALFQLATNVDFPNLPQRRIGGWSESWYVPGISIPTALQLFNGISLTSTLSYLGWCAYRAALLPPGALIVGQRFQVINPTQPPSPGASQTLGQLFPGGWGEPADIPQQALLCSCASVGTNNIKRFTLRGIPDARVVEGEFQASGPYNQLLQAFFTSLNGFLFRGRDLSQTTFNLVGITALGVATTVQAHNYTVGQIVRVLRSKTVDGDLIGGLFRVSAIGPDQFTFTMGNWSPAEATTGGRVRLEQITFPAVDVTRTFFQRATTRRVGRPFTQYRGRRSVRRG
jgi:hypothetical protein